MIKFNHIIYSNKEPNIYSLWLRPKEDSVDFLIWDGGWQSIGSIPHSIIIDSELNPESLNPVSNKVIYEALKSENLNIPTDVLRALEQNFSEQEKETILNNIGAQKKGEYINDAPKDNKAYNRKNGEWEEANSSSIGKPSLGYNSEVFNDYNYNYAFGEYSHAEGKGTNVLHNVSIYRINGTEVYYFKNEIFIPHIGDKHIVNSIIYTIVDTIEWIEYNNEEKLEGIHVTYDKPVEFDISVEEIRELTSFVEGTASHKEGTNCRVLGDSSHAEGKNNIVQGHASHIEGYLNSIYAAYAHAEGRENICLGSNAHVEGIYSIVYGGNSHVEGCTFSSLDKEKQILAQKDIEFIRTLYDNNEYFTVSDKALIPSSKLFEDFIIHASFGERSHVEGTNNSCFDNSSHVEGFGNQCGNMITGHGYALTHNANHVEGKNNYIGGSIDQTHSIHIEGENNSFEGNYKYPTSAVHIEGWNNTIPLLTDGVLPCTGAHLGGLNSRVLGGQGTFAHGLGISVENDYEVAFGKYNQSKINNKKVIFSYGIGRSNSYRENAISVLSDGSVLIPNLTGVSEIDKKLEEIERKVNDGLNKIIGIYNKLSTGDITSSVFVINDALIITNRIEASVASSNVEINNEYFIFADGNLSYNSRDGYLTGAINNNGNLTFIETINNY